MSGWGSAWAPPILIATLIFLGSSLGGGALPTSPFAGSDKLVHLVEYAALGFAICRAFTRRMAARTGTGRRGPAALLGAIAVATLYGVLDELHQTLVPGRVFDLADLLADAVGASLGATVGWRRYQRR